MANNQFQVLPFSQTGVMPRILFLNTPDTYDVITNPGYLNSVQNAGVEFQPNDIIFTSYDVTPLFGMFIVTIDAGVYTMNVYSPNDNSFIFQRVIFVSKGGSDLNTGTSIGAPKLSVQSGIDALNMTSSNHGLVYILDDGIYQEPITLPFNIIVYAPNAVLEAKDDGEDLITVNDTGLDTNAQIVFNQILNPFSNLTVNLMGASSTLQIDTRAIKNNMDIEGTLLLNANSFTNATVNVATTGQYISNVEIQSEVTIVPTGGAIVCGQAQLFDDSPVVNFYGNVDCNQQLIYQTLPNTLTAGKTVAATDSNTRIVYNNAAGGNFTLPQTSDAAIPLGTKIEFLQLGLGAANFVAGASVTIVSLEGDTVATNGAGSVAYAWKYTDTIWVISGDIVDVGP